MLIGIIGDIGSGKTFSQIKYCLRYADRRHKNLVFNFYINRKALKEYCEIPYFVDIPFIGSFVYEILKLIQVIKITFNNTFVGIVPGITRRRYRFKFTPRHPWVLELLARDEGIYEMPGLEDFSLLLKPNSLVCFDEAGIFLNSRFFSKTSKKLITDLAQVRKDGIDFVWTGQYFEQVEKVLRELSSEILVCLGTSSYDTKLGYPKMLLKRTLYFKRGVFQRWYYNDKVKDNYIKTRFAYAYLNDEGPLSTADKKVFDIYDSLGRLDKKDNGKEYNGNNLVAANYAKDEDYGFF